METPTHSIKVPVTFRGIVEVSVPANAPFKEKLAQALALSRVLATTDNPDAPDESSFEDYCFSLGISDDDTTALLAASNHFDCSKIVSLGGVWEGEALPNSRGLFPGDPGYTQGPEIPARLTDDKDIDREGLFDASLWFEHASDDEIRELAEENWGGCCVADDVARFFTGEHFNPKVSDFLDKATGGFEVYVSGDAARDWLKKHRPSLHIPR